MVSVSPPCWQTTIFIDERTFQLHRISLRIWTHVNDNSTFPATKNQTKVNVWGGMSARGLMAVTLFSENLDSKLCRSILNKCLFETDDVLCPDGWRLQHNNTPAHRSRETKEFLAHRNVEVI